MTNLDQPSCHIRIFRDKGIEADAKRLGLTHIYTDASLTAGPFLNGKDTKKQMHIVNERDEKDG
ncbi:hypothetical protein [Lysinibacillus capsici]|uniref:hypothetical protein n=1 Tax=Lysinibacillus capsici TaxID=2115968 RepID=UPI003CFBCBCF